MEATYYDNIMEQQRLEPEFFRVGFYGRKFPFFLRVSQIYSGCDKVTRLRVAVKALYFCLGEMMSTIQHIFNACTNKYSFLAELKDTVRWECSWEQRSEIWLTPLWIFDDLQMQHKLPLY